MSVDNKREPAHIETLINLLVSGRDLPSDFLESLQAWLIDDDGGKVKEEVLQDRFEDQVSAANTGEYALKLWPDLAKRLEMNPELARETLSKAGKEAEASRNVSASRPARQKTSRWKHIIRYSAAAVILLAVGVTTFFLMRQPRTDDLTDLSASIHTVRTAAGETISFTLPDGSEASLSENTTLSYADDFITNRKVTIDGEAFLHVVRNEQFPFTIDNKDIQVVVLGTEFNVRDFDGSEDAEITLISGRVTVASGDHIVTLNPGEKAIVDKINRNIKTVWLELCFDDVSLHEVLHGIGKHFGINMSIAADVPQVDGIMMNLDYDATLGDALFVLQAINPVFDYRMQDSTIVVSRHISQ